MQKKCHMIVHITHFKTLVLFALVHDHLDVQVHCMRGCVSNVLPFFVHYFDRKMGLVLLVGSHGQLNG